MILAATHRADIFSFEFRDDRGRFSLIIIRSKTQLTIVIPTSRIDLFVILAHKNAMVVTARSKGHNFIGQSFNLFRDTQTSEVSLAQLTSLIKAKRICPVILIDTDDMFTAIESKDFLNDFGVKFYFF